MTIKKAVHYEQTAQDCSHYQPIQALKRGKTVDFEIAEEADCDSCVHYKKEQCDIYVNEGFEKV